MTRAGGGSLLSVRNLTVVSRDRDADRLELLQRISFELQPGEVVGLVGESGSGKTLLVHAILRLLHGRAAIASGEIAFDGVDLATIPEDALDDIRGRRIGLIPQDASLALNPVLRIEDQVGEVIGRHLGLRGSAVRDRSLEVLQRVGLAAPERVLRAFPAELSGGMKQRVGIALALACDPVLLLADDPTSAVDVTIQAQILTEMRDLAQRTGVAILFISHDLRIISSVCTRLLVLYGGQLVEEGLVTRLLERPYHPYTGAMIDCTPSVDARLNPLPVVAGASPTDPGALPGCRFHPRCSNAIEACRVDIPEFIAVADDRRLACWNPLDG